MAKIHFLYSFFYLLIAKCIAVEIPTTRIVPAIFIFGDSVIDVGTNNYIDSYARANFQYNGIDFNHSRPTGRFSNGYNIGDQLAMKLGFKKSPPAFLYLLNNTRVDFKKKIQRGVNFASAGAGILNHTGFEQWHEVINMSEQILQFTSVIGNITDARGPKATAKLLSKAFYIFSFGANEFFDYMRLKNKTLSQDQLLAIVQSGYHDRLKTIYNLGARRFGVMGVPPIGCCPYARSINIKNGDGDICMPLLNNLAQGFYNSTLTLLQRMALELPKFKFSFGNTYSMTMDMFNNSDSYGFTDIKTACCGLGQYYNGDAACYKPIQPNLCPNRSEYVFWDLFHSSEAASQISADKLFSGDATYMTPMNFKQLAEIEVQV